jgi:hypothetical protein
MLKTTLFLFVLLIHITLQLVSHKHILYDEFTVESIATGNHGQIYLVGQLQQGDNVYGRVSTI